MDWSHKLASMTLSLLLALSLSGCGAFASGFFGLFGNGGGYGNPPSSSTDSSDKNTPDDGLGVQGTFYEIVSGLICPDGSAPGYRRKIVATYEETWTLVDACSGESTLVASSDVEMFLYGLVIRHSDGGLFEARSAVPEAGGHRLELVCQSNEYSGAYGYPGIAIWSTAGVSDRAAKLWRTARTDSYSVAKTGTGNDVSYVGGNFNLNVDLSPSVPRGNLVSPIQALFDCYRSRP